jgi:sporulation protein YlmC with PRC-barrel domain
MLLMATLVLLACQMTLQGSKQTSDSANPNEEVAPTDPASQSGEADPDATQAEGDDDSNPVDWDMPPQSQAAEIQPKNLRTELTHLSNLFGYEVLDDNGDRLGVASDYIVNTCETYIIYILMEPAAGLGFPAGDLVVIPLEAVTINSGVLNAENKTIQLLLVPEQIEGAPTLTAGQDLTPTDWEAAVRTFWKRSVRIGELQTSCNVPGGPVYKVTYATRLLGVELYDGQNVLLGAVQEAILEPESGKIAFYIVKPAEGDGLVMVLIAATNIPKEALNPGGVLTLELLTDPELFWDAPRISSIGEADDFSLQGSMRQYWGG